MQKKAPTPLEKTKRIIQKRNSLAGFTLIEVLIVVIILSILATIALPQFKQVVWKSRYREVFNIVSGIVKAEQLYYLEGEVYTEFTPGQCEGGDGIAAGSTDVQEALGVDIPKESYFRYLIGPTTADPATTISFKTVGNDWAYSYNYITNTWAVGSGADGGPARQYFNPPD
ncbi:type IV pilin protein [Candidatus Omnitrophota bacterium]